MRRKKGYQPMGVEAFIEACPTCKNQGSELCGECREETNSGYEPEEERGITNADRIRSMSDEELAKFLCRNMTQDCSVCPGTKYCSVGHNGLIKWLGLPAEGEFE